MQSSLKISVLLGMALVLLAPVVSARAQFFVDRLVASECSAVVKGDDNVVTVNCSTISSEQLEEIMTAIDGGLRQAADNRDRYMEQYVRAEIRSWAAQNIDLPAYFGFQESPVAAETRPVQVAYGAGKTMFDNRDYANSALLLREAFDNAENRQSRARIGELVTASLFANGQHIEGLEFICERYASLPKNDHRYRHDIHSHVRAIAAKQGYRIALSTVSLLRFRRGCNRGDMSPIWAAIPIDIGWAIERGWPRKYVYDHTGPIPPADLELLKRLTSAGVPFADYGHYVLLEFDAIIENYPNSYLYEDAFAARVEFAGNAREAERLEKEFEARYPGSTLVPYMRKQLVEKFIAANDFAAAATASSRIDPAAFRAFEEERDLFDFYRRPLDVFLKKRKVWLTDFRAQLRIGNYDVLPDMFEQYRLDIRSLEAEPYNLTLDNLDTCIDQRMEAFRLHVFYPERDTEDTVDPADPCADEFFVGDLVADELLGLRFAIADANVLSLRTINTANNYIEEVARRLDNGSDEEIWETLEDVRLCTDYELVERYEQDRCLAVMWGLGKNVGHELLFSTYDYCAINCSPDYQVKALYLHASHLKRHRDFAESTALFKRIAQDYPQSHLVDDALTEVGYYYFAIRKDFSTAIRHFQTVVETYPDRNAYDNALNWLAILYRHTGDFGKSLDYSLRLVRTAADQRLKRFASERVEELRQLSDETLSHAMSDTVTFCNRWHDFFGSGWEQSFVAVCDVKRGSQPWRAGVRPGMRVLLLAEQPVVSVYEMARLSNGSTSLEIVFDGGWNEETFETIKIRMPFRALSPG
ncbi:tetratricopeptide repeat protein [Hoeflea sp. WL0058]|uniref:Tetratricopeptide repeat protein n=1 Tax=Flavimaribacter sediminis TaxID=2865987 RepID=A0AAE3D247_9HYPH|nr:tetratricopeptide repeat protein [Flavimaribacter sediminis]MBW8638138.1 tetratricopeptide repeat protein [Flavimaribacter sediminis]